jgi:hypothetical protein
MKQKSCKLRKTTVENSGGNLCWTLFQQKSSHLHVIDLPYKCMFNSMYNDWPTFPLAVKKMDNLSSKLTKPHVEVHLFGMNGAFPKT